MCEGVKMSLEWWNINGTKWITIVFETTGYRLLHFISLWIFVTISIFLQSFIFTRLPRRHSRRNHDKDEGCLHESLIKKPSYLFLRACCLLKCLLIETQPSAILLRWTSMWSMGSGNAVSLSTSHIHLCQVLCSSQILFIPNHCTKSEGLL